MTLSTEVFVLMIFLIGFPLFWGVLRNAKLPGARWFLLTYFFMLCSNIFTVLEEFAWNTLFNTLEHASLCAGAFSFSPNFLSPYLVL